MVLSGRRAEASEVFPGAIQEAANMPCVPLCTLCHTTNPGNATSWQQKKLPTQLLLHGVKIGNADSLKTAFAAYMNDASIPAADRQATLAQIQAGKDQNGMDICGPSYGCGAHVAKQEAMPRDLTGPLWIVGAVVIGALRRRKRAA